MPGVERLDAVRRAARHAALPALCALGAIVPLARHWLAGRTLVWFDTEILYAPQRALVDDALRALKGKLVRVEGHTDNVPTNGAGNFPTNWELSSARALAVVRFLQECGVDPTRLSGAGFGEFQPISPNDTPEGRSLNRRIEIVLVPLEGAVPTPPSPAPAKT